eukprot:g2942.t1
MVEIVDSNPSYDCSKEKLDGLLELRQIGDRLPSDSWHIDAVLPPNAGEMVYEDLQPTLDKFFSFEVEIVDDTKRYRYLDISNTRSVANIGSDRALLPMKLDEGWQRINIDLERTVRLVFGSSYLTTSQIVIRASARIAKVFFQSQQFSDYELPCHLRVVAE